jgi:hypothetical protein
MDYKITNHVQIMKDIQFILLYSCRTFGNKNHAQQVWI